MHACSSEHLVVTPLCSLNIEDVNIKLQDALLSEELLRKDSYVSLHNL